MTPILQLLYKRDIMHSRPWTPVVKGLFCCEFMLGPQHGVKVLHGLKLQGNIQLKWACIFHTNSAISNIKHFQVQSDPGNKRNYCPDQQNQRNKLDN